MGGVPQIEVKNLIKTYPGGTKGIESVSFTVKKGELIAYLGPNGSGKTTTLNILATLLIPDSGDCFISGFNVMNNANKIRQIIGYLPENFGLYPNFTVYQNIEFFAKLRLKNVTNLKKIIEDNLELMGLWDKRNEKASSLSKGLTQRVGIIIATINNPDILLLDEPTSGLDPRATRNLLNILKNINDTGTTILLSTHALSIAEKIANNVIIIDKGQLLLSSSIDSAKRALQSRDLEGVYFTITEGGNYGNY